MQKVSHLARIASKVKTSELERIETKINEMFEGKLNGTQKVFIQPEIVTKELGYDSEKQFVVSVFDPIKKVVNHDLKEIVVLGKFGGTTVYGMVFHFSDFKDERVQALKERAETQIQAPVIAPEKTPIVNKPKVENQKVETPKIENKEVVTPPIEVKP
jgi:hypothetical protein